MELPGAEPRELQLKMRARADFFHLQAGGEGGVVPCQPLGRRRPAAFCASKRPAAAGVDRIEKAAAGPGGLTAAFGALERESQLGLTMQR